MDKRALYAMIALLISSYCSASLAQEPDQTSIVGLVVIEGPYELQGDGGVVGYVLKRSGDLAAFQPCNAPIQWVKSSRLNPTSFDCKDEPGVDPNPMNVSCEIAAGKASVLVAAANGNPQSDPAGTVYAAHSAGGPVEKSAPGDDPRWDKWSEAAAVPVSGCSDRYVYLPLPGTNSGWIGYLRQE